MSGLIRGGGCEPGATTDGSTRNARTTAKGVVAALALPVSGPASSQPTRPPLPSLHLWVPITSSTSCDQVIFVDHATEVSLFSDAVQVEVDRLW